ncbi:MAG: FxLYD domain-containing protein [Fimbriimonas sp.]
MMKPATIACLALAAVVIAYFVWPTPYLLVANAGVVKRVHRISGVEEFSSSKGWIRADGSLVGQGDDDVTSQIRLTKSNQESSSGLWNVVVQNQGENVSGLRLRFSFLDGDGVVVGTTTEPLEELRQGDQRSLQIVAQATGTPVSKLRLDQALAN